MSVGNALHITYPVREVDLFSSNAFILDQVGHHVVQSLRGLSDRGSSGQPKLGLQRANAMYTHNCRIFEMFI